jgi:putative FmdB family regulatory protein
MPIYEYECQACEHRFEAWQKMSDKPIKVCPKCKARKLEKLISHTSFQLKGGGWYSDLYASAKPATDAKGKDAKESSAGSSDSSGSSGGGQPAASAPSTSSNAAPKSPQGKGKANKGAAKAAA